MAKFLVEDGCDRIRDRRLLVVTETLGLGGTESHLVRTTPQLAELGWKIAIFCLTERGERAGDVEAHGVKVFSALRLARRKDLLRYPAHLSLAANRLYWLMRRWRPQIAHFYLPAPYLVSERLLPSLPMVARVERAAKPQDGCRYGERTRGRSRADHGRRS